MKATVLSFVPALLLCARGWAQDLPTKVAEPGRKQESVEEAQKAAKESQKRKALEAAPEVTYEQVMAHPDDIQLNYRYALSQVKQGNLRSAAATLERILMVDPELPRVRLVYAVVLFRLDNLADAQRELEALRPQKMPESLRSELNDYLGQIRRRRRRTHLNVLVGAGFDWDDNRNAAPALGRRLFFDVPIILDANSTRISDTAKTMLASAELHHDLGYQAGHEVYAKYNYYRAEQTKIRTLNLQNHYGEAGFVYKAGWADFTADGEFDHLLLTQTTYLRSRGARLRIDRKLTLRLSAFGETAYTRQVYNRTLIVTAGDQRSGDKIEGTGGLSFVLTPTMSLLASYTHINQGALAKFDAYKRESVQVGHTWLLGRGEFLLSSLTVNFDRYDQPEAVVSQNYRHDNTYRARGTFGIPLDFIARRQWLNDLILTFTYEYYYATSRDIPNYSYTDNKVSSLLTYKFGI